MKQKRHEYVTALLVVLAAVTGAAMIMTIPSLFGQQQEPQVWVTAALACAFLALASFATRERRRHLSRHR